MVREAGFRRPDFFLIGAPRCGTTSMYLYLQQHPEIFLSVLKEPHFFSTDHPPGARPVADEALYHSLFKDVPATAKRVGEGSISYLSSLHAPDAIRAYSPSPRFLVMLRNPIDMVFSLHGLYTRTGNEDEIDFDRALAAQEMRRRGEKIPAGAYFPQGLVYTESALYTERLKRYFRLFGREFVHVVIFDDFVAEPARVYRETLDFLEVDTDFEAEFDRQRAKAVVRMKTLLQLRKAAPEIRARLRGLGLHHTAPRREAMTEETRQRLAEFFAPDIGALSALLERDLSAWCGEY